MSLPRYYLAIVAITVIIIGGVILILHGLDRGPVRNPNDVAWMERVRRSALEGLEPLRDRMNVVESQALITRAVNPPRGPVTVTMDLSECTLATEFIRAARESVLETSEWIEEDPTTAPIAPTGARRLFELKDHLWRLTLTYLDILLDIFSSDREIDSGEVILLEQQLDRFAFLLEEELDNLGLGPVE